MGLTEKLKTWFAPHEPLPREVLHFQTSPDADAQYRLHLRVEEDGRGLLVVNAATVLHLNQTAAEFARFIIQEADEGEVARTISKRYRVSRWRALADYQRLRDHIYTLATSVDLCPVTYLDLERADPFSAETSAPYRVDLALTYRVDATGGQDPEARRRVDRELATDEWQQVLQTLWDVGVPHVCFTGGEPTLRDDLVGLVRRAEELGLVTGLLTDGRRLRDQQYLDELLLAGLDHLQITLTSHQAAVHDRIVGRPGSWQEATDGLRNSLAADIYVVVHMVVTEENADSAAQTVVFLAELGVPAVALSSPMRSLSEEARSRLQAAMEAAEAAAHEREMAVVWDLAAPYSHVNPVEVEAEMSVEQVVRQHLYVEPDGDVLPVQGYNVVLGNLLRSPWASIWDHPERTGLGAPVSA